MRLPSISRLCVIASALTLLGVTPSIASSQSLPTHVAAALGEWVDLQRASEWRGYRRDTLPGGWRFDAASGELTFAAGHGGGDIVTRRQFGNFELEIEWRIAAGGNSGIFYRATEGTGAIYENAPEMQVLDNARHADGRSPLTSAGSNFGLYGPAQDVSRPAGEWNRARLVVRGGRVEHWLNDTKVVEYTLWSDEWKRLVAASKFAAWPAYGWATRGFIGLQDHGDTVSFRRMRIREIAP